MTLATTALIATLGLLPSLQADGAPRAETRTEVRVIHAGPGGPGGPGSLDADRDGSVTRDEFSAPMTTAFDRLDADHDGRLSSTELESQAGPGEGGPGPHVFVLPGGPGGPDMPGAMVFTMRRPGGTEGGPGGALAHGPGHSERRVEIRRFGGPGGDAQMDTDGDGKVSEAEFLAPLREAFQRLDADHDGSLGDGERPAAPPPPPPAG